MTGLIEMNTGSDRKDVEAVLVVVVEVVLVGYIVLLICSRLWSTDPEIGTAVLIDVTKFSDLTVNSSPGKTIFV